MPRLEIHLDSHLLVAGGQVAALGVDQATALRFHQGQWVPYIPATALRGAVRIQLEALLAGAERAGTGPYPFDPNRPGAEPLPVPDHLPDDVVARLFGFSGPQGERTFSKEGCLRFGDALPVSPEAATAALRVRTGVELDDERGTAEDHKLYSRQVAEASSQTLTFEAQLLTGEASSEALRLLRLAVETTSSLGASKSSGGGEIRIHWREEEEPPSVAVHGDPATAPRARLRLTLREPAHFGDGGPHGNHHATRTWIPGSTVRGALAWALLRGQRTTPQSPGFRELFLDEASPVSFGDALAVAEPSFEPEVRPLTRREVRGSGRPVDLLVAELARERINRHLAGSGSGLYLRSEEATTRLDSLPPRSAELLLRRTRTRVSVDRERGTAKDGKLFSIEQIEPWQATDETEPSRPTTFVAWVEGLRPAGARLLAQLEGLHLLLGAGRNHGLGWTDLEVRFEEEAEETWEDSDLRALAEAVTAASRSLAPRAGLEELPDHEDGLPVALVAGSDFVPAEDLAHPLAQLLPEAGPPLRRFLTAGASGGYDQRPERHRREAPRPLKSLRPTVAAGSVFVYSIGSEDLQRLPPALSALRRGVGERIESGCGRFHLFTPFDSQGETP